MKAFITVESERYTETHYIVVSGKTETINQKIADEVNNTIYEMINFGKKPYRVTVRIMVNNRIIDKWTYKPTIR